ncbi:MAG: hypothetical protein US69_C0015G0011 [candidate division TM6 bacterium GW2011_GWF2_38_10]|nr:MAG: hypothetical protein US69_C0015G0011 [candidate division TM6 bacterium GW2011_GWF2_38_10]
MVYGNSTSHQSQDTRKFNTANALYSLAGACANAGNAAAAQTQQEKQQAVCNFAASLLQTAAVLAEKSNKKKSDSITHIKALIETTTAYVANLLPEEKEELLNPECSYLKAITSFKTHEEKEKFINLLLKKETESLLLINEITLVLKTILHNEIGTLFYSVCQESIKG